ncbi:MAG: hypothetical protein IIA45_09755 [Bacteroidetes bacterium]|nr:hypothetical protein [Bacteroidota bacterium]
MNGFVKICNCYILTFTYVAFSCEFLLAQNPTDDFNKMLESYLAIDKIRIEQEYRYYRNYATTEAYQTENGVLIREKENLYSNSFDIERIMNSKYMMLIDHEMKIIAVKKPENLKKKDLLSFNTDSLLMFCNRVEYLTQLGGLVGYRFSFSWGKYEYLDIIYNPSTYLINKTVWYFRQPFSPNEKDQPTKPRIEIVNTKILIDPDIENNKFSTLRYLSIVNGNIALTSAYSDYKLINYIR